MLNVHIDFSTFPQIRPRRAVYADIHGNAAVIVKRSVHGDSVVDVSRNILIYFFLTAYLAWFSITFLFIFNLKSENSKSFVLLLHFKLQIDVKLQKWIPEIVDG